MTGPTHHDPLDPTERALADALARAPGPRGPSPALDAAILGAARAAAAVRTTAGTGAPARHHRRRSPAWLRGGALAASLVFAVGVAWQLRPGFDAAGPAVEERAVSAPTPAARAAAEPSGHEAARDAAAPASAAPGTASEAPDAVAAPAASAARTPKQVQAPEEPPVVFDEPSPMDSPAPRVLDMPAPPPAPPAPPASPEPVREDRRALSQRAAPAPRSPAPAIHAEDAGHDGHADGEDWLDQPLDDTPPASVDSPQVREAWLTRIRELVSAERYTEARESFAEFRRRHPDAPVPADLRMLLGAE